MQVMSIRPTIKAAGIAVEKIEERYPEYHADLIRTLTSTLQELSNKPNKSVRNNRIGDLIDKLAIKIKNKEE